MVLWGLGVPVGGGAVAEGSKGEGITLRSAEGAGPGASSEHAAPSHSWRMLTLEVSPSSSTVTVLTHPMAGQTFEHPATGMEIARIRTAGRTTSPHTLFMEPV